MVSTSISRDYSMKRNLHFILTHFKWGQRLYFYKINKIYRTCNSLTIIVRATEPFSLVKLYQNFGGTRHLHIQFCLSHKYFILWRCNFGPPQHHKIRTLQIAESGPEIAPPSWHDRSPLYGTNYSGWTKSLKNSVTVNISPWHSNSEPTDIILLNSDPVTTGYTF